MSRITHSHRIETSVQHNCKNFRHRRGRQHVGTKRFVSFLSRARLECEQHQEIHIIFLKCTSNAVGAAHLPRFTKQQTGASTLLHWLRIQPGLKIRKAHVRDDDSKKVIKSHEEEERKMRSNFGERIDFATRSIRFAATLKVFDFMDFSAVKKYKKVYFT